MIGKVLRIGFVATILIPAVVSFLPGHASARGAHISSSLAARATAVSGPVIDVSPASHDFGRVNVGGSTGTSSSPTKVVGDMTGNINGTPVNLHVYVSLDYATGMTHAELTNVPASLGSSLRVVMSHATIAGCAAALTSGGAVNCGQLLGGNFSRDGTLNYLDTGDSIRIVQSVSYTAGDTVSFTGTMNGSIPNIPEADSVALGDMHELWHLENPTQLAVGFDAGSQQTYQTGLAGGPWVPDPPKRVRHGKVVRKNPCIPPRVDCDIILLPFDEIRILDRIVVRWNAVTRTVTWDMRNQMIPAANRFPFTVSNRGEAELHVLGLTHSGPGFSAVLGSQTIPVGGSTTLSAAYTPSGSGPQSDNITLVTNADNGNFSVLATGRANNAPTFTPPLAASYNAPAYVSFTLTASASDPEGDGLGWSIASTPALPVGATFDGANGTLSWTPEAADAGNYNVTITVTDGLAHSDGNFTVHVTAANSPPTANAGGPYSGSTNVPLAMNGTGSSDPDAGQTLTYDWNFGDGNTGTGVTPSHTYIHAGNYIVSLTVTDNGSPVLNATTTTSASIVDFVPIEIVLAPGTPPVLKKKGNMLFGIESYTRPLTDIDPNSLFLTTTYPNAGTVSQVALTPRKGYIIGDINANLFYDLDVSIKGDLRPLVSNVPGGATITVVFNFFTYGSHLPVRGTIDLVKQGGGGAAPFQGLAAVSSAASLNPFKLETTIRYAVPAAGPVSIRVYSVRGQLVRTLRQESGNPGTYEVRWNGKDDQGRQSPSGIYFVSVQQGAMNSTTRLVLAR
jgi:PKD repeat protein